MKGDIRAIPVHQRTVRVTPEEADQDKKTVGYQGRLTRMNIIDKLLPELDMGMDRCRRKGDHWDRDRRMSYFYPGMEEPSSSFFSSLLWRYLVLIVYLSICTE